MKPIISRRNFIKTTAITGLAASIMPTSLLGSSSQKVQIGIIGTGFRGQWVSQLLLSRPDVDIPVICDIDDIMIGKVLKIFEIHFFEFYALRLVYLKLVCQTEYVYE